MKRLSMILLGVLTLPAYGGIASVEYTNSKIDEVSKAIEAKANKTGYAANMLLQTGDDGKLTATTLKTNMIENGAVTNSKLASNIGLDKLAMGDLPTSGKHIMIWNSATNKYVFEELMGLAEIDWDAIDNFIKDIFEDDIVREYSYVAYSLEGEACMGMSVDKNGEEIEFGVLNGGSCRDKEFAGMIPGELKLNMPGINAELKMTGLCSSSTGTEGTIGSPSTNSSGTNCWCQMTAPATSSWMYLSDLDDNDCTTNCPAACLGILTMSDARSVLINSAKQ